MNENSYLEQILARVNEVGKDWKELFSGQFRLQEVFALVGSLVDAAEAIITSPGSGAQKHQLVKEAFAYFDREYQIIARIDDLVALPIWIEPFDGPFLRRVIDFLIGQAVSIFNATIWKEANDTPVGDDLRPSGPEVLPAV